MTTVVRSCAPAQPSRVTISSTNVASSRVPQPVQTRNRGAGMANWSVDHIDDIRELEPVGECPIRPIRHHFGISAFGVNAWTAKAAGDRLINEHEEDPGNEELYIVTRGRAVFELDGERRDAGEGT